ncbi:hypothetical protein G6F56_012833 [Rhizopus delemar]|nr:hypothetical protein G6F56_012833 [Rhizopus delemar]
MGVNGLTNILKRYAPKSILDVKPSFFSKQTIAVDASCHLNKFIYGDDPHPYKHIYGFYLLSLYFDMNKIQPIFVFDGANRLKAKQLEQEKRERQQTKIAHSLMFEQEQADRLDTWLKIAEDFALELPKEKNALRLLDDLDRSLEKVDRSVTQVFEEEKAIATTLNQIKHSLKEAIVQVADTEKYTKTARMLADREKKLLKIVPTDYRLVGR